LAQVHIADHGAAGLVGDVVLDQDPVLEHPDLGTGPALPDRHHPVDRLTAGQELRLGENRRPGTPLLPAIPTSLTLRLQPRRAGHALDFVLHRPRLADLDHGLDAVVVAGLGVGGSLAAATPTTPYRGGL